MPARDKPQEEGLLSLPLNRFVIKKVTTYRESENECLKTVRAAS